MKTWLFNPFKYIAGGKALFFGIITMLITSIACYFGSVHLDGVLDIHRGAPINITALIIEPVLDWFSLVIPLYFFGRALSASSIRFIDITGTIALARYPLFFAVLLTVFFLPDIKTPQDIMNAIQTNPALITKLALLSSIVVPFIIWTIALMYNAYSVSANLKGSKAIWSFVASMLIAEILSKVIIISII